MAGLGRFGPEDLVRRGPTAAWVKAKQVRGLFGASAIPQPPSRTPASKPAPEIPDRVVAARRRRKGPTAKLRPGAIAVIVACLALILGALLLVRSHSSPDQVALAEGRRYAHTGDLDKALERYSEAIRLNPGQSTALAYRAGVLVERGKYQDAVIDCKAAIEHDPKCLDAYVNLSNAYYFLNDLPSALTATNEALRYSPNDTRAMVALGRVYFGQSKDAEAIDVFSKVLRTHPSNDVAADAHFQRGLTYRFMGNVDAAISDFNASIPLNPSFSPTYVERGALLLNKGDLDSALADFNHAIEALETNRASGAQKTYLALAYANRAVAQCKLGESASARADCARALALDPTNKLALRCMTVIEADASGQASNVASAPKASSEANGFSKPVQSKPGETFTNSIGMKLVLIPAGKFVMGSPFDEFGHEDNETRHWVRISQPFYIAIYEVTQDEYRQVMRSNPSFFSPSGKGSAQVQGKNTDRFPAEQVSWFDAVEFCNTLSATEGLGEYYTVSGENVSIAGGRGYRLPTEAEWEYACRAGTLTPFNVGKKLDEQTANYNWPKTSSDRTNAVGAYTANAFGIYDMHGNVSEWCYDWTGRYGSSSSTDPYGPSDGAERVVRGGNWRAFERACRSASRSESPPSTRWNAFGFRCVRDLGRATATHSEEPLPDLGGSASDEPEVKHRQLAAELRRVYADHPAAQQRLQVHISTIIALTEDAHYSDQKAIELFHQMLKSARAQGLDPVFALDATERGLAAAAIYK